MADHGSAREFLRNARQCVEAVDRGVSVPEVFGRAALCNLISALEALMDDPKPDLREQRQDAVWEAMRKALWQRHPGRMLPDWISFGDMRAIAQAAIDMAERTR